MSRYLIEREFPDGLSITQDDDGANLCCVLLALSVLGISMTSLAEAAVKNVVLVHGAFADGSGCTPMATILERDGYTVYVVQIPETGYEAEAFHQDFPPTCHSR